MSRKKIEQYKDMILYAFFGICTTLVNIIIYWFTAYIVLIPPMTSTAAAWFAAVFFAYFTNRRWVFHSNANGWRTVATELFSFFTCRFLTGILDLFCMWFFAGICHFNDLLIKTLSNMLVILLNYAASKIVVFKKHRK